ncbi:hypothetical protein [Sporosarcina sp. FSL K6-5500]|uniref:hypothetical protein n=1 Tax=Sporosarcina sp. FSL K6-5500 TaxID=2921558 RepID=UPI0030F5BB88
MVIAFQIILLFIIFISFLIVIGERKDQKLRDTSASVLAWGLLYFAGSVLFL